MKVTRLEEGFVVMRDENFAGVRLYESAAAAVIHMTVESGREIAPHVAPVDMEFYVLEGRGVFTVGDESAEAEPGSLIESQRDVPHGIRNPGPGPLRVLAIKNGVA